MAALPKVIKFSEDGKLFLKTFLIDASINENEWGVTADSIPQNIESVIGKPVVLVSNFDHPQLVDNRRLEPNLEYQKRFSIGNYTKYFQDGSVWWGIAEVTDPLAREAIENNDIPFFVSPRIFRLDITEPRTATKKWTFVHGAIVDKPAYGAKATIPAVCEGSSEQCTPALLSANTGVCACTKTALLSLLTKQNDSSHSSHVQDGKKLQNVMGDNATPTPTVDLSGYVPKADYEAKVAELTALKGAFEQAKTAYDSRLAAIELENTTNKITAILSAKIEDKAELDKKVKYFVEAKVSPDVVAEAFKLVPDVSAKQAAKGKDNSGKFEQASNEKPSNFEQMIAYESRRFA